MLESYKWMGLGMGMGWDGMEISEGGANNNFFIRKISIIKPNPPKK